MRLAPLFEEAVGLDPDPEMIAEGRRAAEERGMANIRVGLWRRQGGADGDPPYSTRETASRREVFVYFKHEEEGKGPEFARLLMQRLGIAT